MLMADIFDKVIELAKRRGIFWPSYEIYGGVGGLYDLGPVGVRIKNNIVNLWRRVFIGENSDFVVEIETPIITPYKVLEASGHLEHFTDPIVECSKCHRVYRADQLIEEVTKKSVEGLPPEELDKIIKENSIKCPSCGGELENVKLFNLLFKTTIGPYSENIGFMRPETAQGMFTAFKRVYTAWRERLPLGIAQIGRVARNEISPRQGLLRLREFTIMEIEFFIDPNSNQMPPMERVRDQKLNVWRAEYKAKGEHKIEQFSVEELVSEKIVINPWMAYWMATANKFVTMLGIPSDKIYFEEKLPHERAHYSSQTFDQIVTIYDERIEVSGHAYRSDYDLSRHSKFSGQDLTVFKKYESPKIVKKKTVIINNVNLNKENKEFVKKVMELVKQKSIDELQNMLKEGYKIDDKALSNYVSIVEREEKVFGEKIIPHVVEPSFGAERLVYVSVTNSYREKKDRIILSLPKEIAPFKVAVFPLLEREDMLKKAQEVYNMLKVSYRDDVIYDDVGSIGKRYARADEIGIPYSITIDSRTLSDNTVTIRDRDTWNQIRVPIEKLNDILDKLFRGESLNNLGEPVRESNE